MTKRHVADAYFTPAPLARMCLEMMAQFGLMSQPGRVLEPACGAGAFGREVANLWPNNVNVRGCDIEDHRAPFSVDLCPVEKWRPLAAGWTWVVTNPPYRGIRGTIPIYRQLQRSVNLPQAPAALGLLLRGTMLAGLVRSDDPPHAVFSTDQRPKWEGPGGALHDDTDRVDAIFAVWWTPDKAAPGTPVPVRPMPDWRPRGRVPKPK